MKLPEEILTKIYIMYCKKYVMKELKYNEKIVGFGNTSKQLKKLLENDVGTYQEGYSEIEEMMEDHKLLSYKKDGMCIECKEKGTFPCRECNNYFFNGQMNICLMF